MKDHEKVSIHPFGVIVGVKFSARAHGAGLDVAFGGPVAGEVVEFLDLGAGFGGRFHLREGGGGGEKDSQQQNGCFHRELQRVNFRGELAPRMLKGRERDVNASFNASSWPCGEELRELAEFQDWAMRPGSSPRGTVICSPVARFLRAKPSALTSFSPTMRM